MMNRREKEIRDFYGEMARVFTGCYRIDNNGSGYITDILDQQGNEVHFADQLDEGISLLCTDTLRQGEYYSVLWRSVSGSEDDLEVIPGSAKLVSPTAIISGVYESNGNVKGDARKNLIKSQDTVVNEVTSADHTFIYELLQNANDYPYGKDKVKVQFIQTGDGLVFRHTGEIFTASNVKGLCGIGSGDKRKNRKAIGYKGIGFKTVFAKNDYVYLLSGEWSFRFDEKETKKKQRGSCPWILMPVSTSVDEIGENASLFKEGSTSGYRVQFLLRPRIIGQEYGGQFSKVFSNEQVLLFIPNVEQAEVVSEGKVLYHVDRKSEQWITYDDPYLVTPEMKEWIKINSGGTVPEKFQYMDEANISFAIHAIDGVIEKVEGARVFNYLPTEKSIGVDFLINADFIPDANRSGLHNIDWNYTILREAGKRFVHFFAEMVSSGKYDLDSVFSILPTEAFEDAFSKAFKEGFYEEIKDYPFIPVDGEDRLYSLKEMIYDSNEYTYGNELLIEDDDLYKALGKDIGIRLPKKEIRGNERLQKLLLAYSSYKLNDDWLLRFLSRGNLSKWLLETSHNARLLEYALDVFKSKDMMELQIFLGADGTLHKSTCLFYELDDYCEDLSFLGNLVDRLHPNVREHLEQKIPATILNYSRTLRGFKKFDPIPWAENFIRGYDLKKRGLENLVNSMSFIHFLSIAGKDVADFNFVRRLPIAAEDGTFVIGSIFVRDKYGTQVEGLEWVEKDWIRFIHPTYWEKDEKEVKACLAKLGIHAFGKQDVVSTLLKEHQLSIQSYLKNSGDSDVAFYRYLSTLDDVLSAEDTRLMENYSVRVHNRDGNCRASLKRILYFSEPQIENLIQKKWFSPTDFYILDESYFSGLAAQEVEALKSFFTRRLSVYKYDAGDFFRRQVDGLESRIRVLSRINDAETSIDFLEYLFENRKTFFPEDVPSAYTDRVRMDVNGTMTAPLNGTLTRRFFVRNEDLESIEAEPWYSAGSALILNDAYRSMVDGSERRNFFEHFHIHPFSRLSFVKNVLLTESGYKKYGSSVNNEVGVNVAFHKFISGFSKELNPQQVEGIKRYKIGMLSGDEASSTDTTIYSSCRVPVDGAAALIGRGDGFLSDLKLLHPAYAEAGISEEYFTKTLEMPAVDIDGLAGLIADNYESVNGKIRDKKANIRFWTWVFNSLKGHLSGRFGKLEMLMKMDEEDPDTEDARMLFASEDYLGTSGLDAQILKYAPQSEFVSPLYLQHGEASEWISLFREIGVATDIKSIAKSVLTDLAGQKNEGVFLLLSKISEDLVKKIKLEDGETIKQLESLWLKCSDGEFRHPMSVYVTSAYYGYDSGEMLKDVTVPVSVSDDYLAGQAEESSRAIRNLMMAIADRFGVGVTSESELYARKLEAFTSDAETYVSSGTDAAIVADIARLYAKFPTVVEKQMQNIRLRSGGVLKKPSELYLSSVYGPACDYSGHGVGSLSFVSEEYASVGETDSLHAFFRDLGVREHFSKDNIAQLSEESFARYFWNIYAPKNKASLSQILTEENLKDVPCLPTKKAGVKAPHELYDIRMAIIGVISAEIDCEDRLPDVRFPEWVEKIGLRGAMDVPDCLAYLRLDKKRGRDDVVRWIADNGNASAYGEQLRLFKQEANWPNGKNEFVPMKDLVALAFDDATLQGEFGDNSFVIRKTSLASEYARTQYETICNLFDLTVLSSSTFDRRPVNKDLEASKEAIREIKKRLLFICFRKGVSNWKEIYEKYSEVLDHTEILQCGEIIFFYNENINTDLLYYPETGKRFWYTKTWREYCSELTQWLKKTLVLKESEELIRKWLGKPFDKLIEGLDVTPEFNALLDETEKSKVNVREYEKEEDLSGTVNEDAIIKEDAPQMKDTTFGAESAAGQPVEEASGDGPAYGTSGQQESQAGPGSKTEQPLQSNAKEGSSSTRQEKAESGGDTGRQKPQAPSADDIKLEAPETLDERLEQKWKREANRMVGGYHSPDKPTEKEIATDPESERPMNIEPSSTGNHERHPRANAEQRQESGLRESEKRIQQGSTSAKLSLQREIDKSAILYKMVHECERYSYKWFKLLLELEELEAMNTSAGYRETIRFSYAGLDRDRSTIKLADPVSEIPAWLENAPSIALDVYTKDHMYSMPARAACVKMDSLTLLTAIPEGLTSESLDSAKLIELRAESAGGVHQSLKTRFLQLGFEDGFNMASGLPSNIEFIYGPPGTGKTRELASRIASALSPGVNMLVLTPTNKAADVITKRLLSEHPETAAALSRYGTTQDPDILSYGDILQTRDTMDMSAREANIVITTTIRFPYDTVLPAGDSLSDLNWDVVFIDEASMVRVEEIAYILHTARPRQFVIAGDPKQIQPVCIKACEGENIYRMVGLDGFGDAIENYKRYKVTPLMKQYRSVPSIGGLVSRYSYDGKLQPDPDREPKKPLDIEGFNCSEINFITFETKDLDMMYSTFPVGNSPVQIYSIVFTYNFVQSLVSKIAEKYPQKEYSIGVISPYKAEGDAIKTMLANSETRNPFCDIRCGTVHGFQGDQCDIMVVVLNPSVYNTSGTNVNDPNLINVAISRARDYLFMICPNADSNPSREQEILCDCLVREECTFSGSHDVEESLFGDRDYVCMNTDVMSHQSVNVYCRPKRRFEVKISESALDIQINSEVEER